MSSKNISVNVYEKFKKIIEKQRDQALKAAEKEQQRQAKVIAKQQDRIKRQEEKLRQQREKERERVRIVKQKEFEKRQKALKKIREQERQRYLKQQAKEDRQKLNREQKRWEREIRQEEKRQVKLLDDLKWKGSKKRLRDNRRKLEDKLKKIYKRVNEITPRRVSDAIGRNASKWVIDGSRVRDPLVFLEATTPSVHRLINNTDSVGKKVHTVLVCKMKRSGAETGKNQYTIANFRSRTHNIVSEDDTTTEYEIMKQKMLESFAEFQKKGSGWTLDSVERLEIFITKYKPLNGRSFKPLPEEIKKKKAIINPENDDDKCFKWAFTIADNIPGKDNKRPGRVTKIVVKQSEKYDWMS